VNRKPPELKVLIRNRPEGIFLYYRDPITRKEVSRKAKLQNHDDALKEAGTWQNELLEFRGDGTKWGYFTERFKEEHLAGKPVRSRNCYERAIELFREFSPVPSVSLVTTDLVSRFKSHLVSRGMPLTTVRKHLGHLRAVFTFAERIGALKKRPHFAMPKITTRKFMRGRPITDAEYRKMLEFCHVPFGKEVAPTWQSILQLFRLSGLRLEEGAKLSWTDPPIQVVLDGGDHPFILIYGEAQKNRQDETLPITPELAKWLAKTPAKKRIGLVAPVHGKSGEPLGWEAIGKGISKIGKAAKVVVSENGKFASAHDLRRAFGLEWSRKVRPITLQRLMRHADLQTTMKYYVGMESTDVANELWGGSAKTHSRANSRKSSEGQKTRRKKA
jgi:integrase